MTVLFIATIGPVQPFIVSARRTRDLYAGSTLLSELSKAAARKIAQQKDGSATLIFPALLDKSQAEDQLKPGSSLNVANKIVAVVQLSSEEVRVLGKDVREAINERLMDVRDMVFGKKNTSQKIKLADEVAADKQLTHLVEYSWVAVPFGKNEIYATYEAARKKAEETLAARKNTHVFSPVTWGGHQEKSSIDGKLECVIPAHLYQGQKEQAKELYTVYKAGPHERLSAVDLLKRLSAERLLIPEQDTLSHVVLSTSHIAATPFLQRLNSKYQTMSTDDQHTIKRLWADYIEAVRALVPSARKDEITSPILETLPSVKGLKLLDEKFLEHDVIDRYDGALLFEERLLDDAVNLDKFKDAQAALKEFFGAADMYPSPYYALLLADGDGMGKAIEACAQSDDGQERHRDLSRALSDFSKQVATVVQQHYGSLVYAGGDDVMALLPLNTVLTCAHDLSEKFRAALSDFSYEEDNKKNFPTLSAGLAVVHHVSLLDEALTLARSAEQRAKEQPEKNALAITIRKRSGEDYPLTVSWEQGTQSSQPLISYTYFTELITLYERDLIPKGTAYELRDMLQRLQPAKGDLESEILQDIIQIDAARILRRKLLLPDRLVSREEARKIFTQSLDQIGVEQVEKDGHNAFKIKERANIKQFINALIVAQSFAEEVRERKEKDLLDE